MQHIDTLELLIDLVKRKSVTPDDAGCQEIIAQRLQKIGFDITFVPHGKVMNMWAVRGNAHPILAFAGHTDVVPAGDLEDWDSDPFDPDVRYGKIYGRGTSDMKAALAAMVTAVERFVAKYPDHPESIAFLLTSDEEGEAQDGTLKLMQYLTEQGINIDACIIGEPTCKMQIGDTIKIGRRGSLTGTLTVNGIQGHVAYPHHADNPIPNLAKVIHCLDTKVWDKGNKHFPATTCQVSNIYGGDGVDNVIPGHAKMIFNFRFCTEQTAEGLKAQVNTLLDDLGINYTLDWGVTDHPFLTEPGKFITSVQQAIQEKIGISPDLSTDGGTSDGRYIAATGTHVVELGMCNNCIHSSNENVDVDDLHILSDVYERLLEVVQLKMIGHKKSEELVV